MQVSWLPMARCTSAAATAESTPPDSPQITRDVPTVRRTFAISSSMNAPGVHDGSAPHTSNRKFSITSLPRGVCATSG